MTETVERNFVGVDVGTGSVRAALVSNTGKILKMHVENIETFNPEPDHYEQSSDEIWTAACKAIKEVTSDVDKESIKGIGFDATCSLVIIGPENAPLTVSTTGEAKQNIILWMDHRAVAETVKINETKHPILEYVGGQVSLEMQMPKMLWLKNNIPETYESFEHAFDLPDYLTWRATNNLSRSLCSVTCKWNYDPESKRWPTDFFRKIGLPELASNTAKIGKQIKTPGEPIGNGLSEDAANEMGLEPGTPVAASMIDAHAGALAALGVRTSALGADCPCGGNPFEGKMAVIAGTSACHMSISKEPVNAKGIWGPYKDVLMPDYHLNEGGQSAAGSLLDSIVKGHPAYQELQGQFDNDAEIYKYINGVLNNLAEEKNVEHIALLTKDVHVWPDYHGNRSPVADPNLRGEVVGLEMGTDEKHLALFYLAHVQALAYGTRHIIETLEAAGRKPVEYLVFTGGLAKNTLYVQTHADVVNAIAVVPDEQELVLVGSALLGASASGQFSNLEEATRVMAGGGQMMKANKPTMCYHNKKYKVFLELLADQQKYRKIMQVKKH